MTELTKKHDEEMAKFSSSFTSQIEEQHQMISDLSQQLIFIYSEKQEQEQKLTRLILKMKEKYKECKNQRLNSERKVANLEHQNKAINSLYNKVRLASPVDRGKAVRINNKRASTYTGEQ